MKYSNVMKFCSGNIVVNMVFMLFSTITTTASVLEFKSVKFIHEFYYSQIVDVGHSETFTAICACDENSYLALRKQQLSPMGNAENCNRKLQEKKGFCVEKLEKLQSGLYLACNIEFFPSEIYQAVFVNCITTTIEITTAENNLFKVPLSLQSNFITLNGTAYNISNLMQSYKKDDFKPAQYYVKLNTMTLTDFTTSLGDIEYGKNFYKMSKNEQYLKRLSKAFPLNDNMCHINRSSLRVTITGLYSDEKELMRLEELVKHNLRQKIKNNAHKLTGDLESNNYFKIAIEVDVNNHTIFKSNKTTTFTAVLKCGSNGNNYLILSTNSTDENVIEGLCNSTITFSILNNSDTVLLPSYCVSPTVLLYDKYFDTYNLLFPEKSDEILLVDLKIKFNTSLNFNISADDNNISNDEELLITIPSILALCFGIFGIFLLLCIIYRYQKQKIKMQWQLDQMATAIEMCNVKN